jgi:5-methylthioadenosine/S-adenosylhomocysteine deaminase
MRSRFPEALLHAHIAESAEEITWLQGEHNPFETLHKTLLEKAFWPHTSERAVAEKPEAAGISLINWLIDGSLLNQRTVLAHASFVSAQTALYLQKRLENLETPLHLGIAHCPRSNLALHGSTLDVNGWRSAGVYLPIGLGTDSALSNDDLDIRAEARTAMALHGWTAEEALSTLTEQGARVLGLESQIGKLAVGMSADCVIWQSDEVLHAPAERVLSPKSSLIASFVEGHQIFPSLV